MSFRGAMAGAVLVLAGWCAGAQEPAAPNQPIHTLRVFANLIQIPTLVLDSDERPVEEGKHPQFLMTLDGGKPFEPEFVRLEGDDPISLTVLLESDAHMAALDRVAAASLAKVAAALRPQDRVSVYAVGCEVVRTAEDTVLDASALKAAAERALSAANSKKRGEDCSKTLKLWDAMLYTTEKLKPLPGRRIVVAVTDGGDNVSTRPWHEVLERAQQSGVTVFAIRSPWPISYTYDGAAIHVPEQRENQLNIICQSSGGWLLTADANTLADTFARVIAMVRGRYIVQFRRGDNATPGRHTIAVTTTRGRYFIRPMTATVILADPTLLTDPDVLKNDPARAPEFGKRIVLPPH